LAGGVKEFRIPGALGSSGPGFSSAVMGLGFKVAEEQFHMSTNPGRINTPSTNDRIVSEPEIDRDRSTFAEV
jgi:hypothetical protein